MNPTNLTKVNPQAESLYVLQSRQKSPQEKAIVKVFYSSTSLTSSLEEAGCYRKEGTEGS